LNFFQQAKAQFDAVVASSSRGGERKDLQEVQKDVQFCLSALAARPFKEQHLKRIQETAIAIKAMKTSLSGLPAFVGAFTTIAATKPEHLRASAAKIATLSCLVESTTIHFKDVEVKRSWQTEVGEIKRIEGCTCDCIAVKGLSDTVEIRVANKREGLPAIVMRVQIANYDKAGVSEYLVEPNGVAPDVLEYCKHQIAKRVAPGFQATQIVKVWIQVVNHMLSQQKHQQQQIQQLQLQQQQQAQQQFQSMQQLLQQHLSNNESGFNPSEQFEPPPD
jgi:hypothetical protein